MVRCWSASLGPLIEVRMDFSQVTYAWLSAVGSTCVHGGWTALTAGGVEPWNDVDVYSLAQSRRRNRPNSYQWT